jgi:hypothetical protein
MPLHDWNQVDAGIFHAFHTTWIGEIQARLNHGILPKDYYALAEQHAGGFVADVLALRLPPDEARSGYQYSEATSSGEQPTTVMELPQTTIHETVEIDLVEMRRTVAIRHVSSHRIVALIEIASPANKDRQECVQAIIDKTLRCLARGVHVLLVDILAPTRFDPLGLHYAVRRAAAPDLSEPQVQPSVATLASYQAQRTRFDAFVEHPQWGQTLPPMPVFLDNMQYVHVPLEETYQRAWEGMPAFWRDVVARQTIASH